MNRTRHSKSPRKAESVTQPGGQLGPTRFVNSLRRVPAETRNEVEHMKLEEWTDSDPPKLGSGHALRRGRRLRAHGRTCGRL